jgi:hypothetical protein
MVIAMVAILATALLGGALGTAAASLFAGVALALLVGMIEG